MPVCEVCGKPLGFFQSNHRQCDEQREGVLSDIRRICADFVRGSANSPTTTANLRERVVDRLDTLPRTMQTRSLVLQGLSAAVGEMLADQKLTDDELSRIDDVTNAFAIVSSEIKNSGIAAAIAKAMTLRDVREGKTEPRIAVSGYFPVVMKKNENLIWVFEGVQRAQPKKRVKYVGGSPGISLRLVKGVSVRLGNSKGERVETTELQSMEVGALAITNQFLHFIYSEGVKSIKISSINGVNRFDGGIIVSVNRGKEQYFSNVDAVFASELILLIASL